MPLILIRCGHDDQIDLSKDFLTKYITEAQKITSEEFPLDYSAQDSIHNIINEILLSRPDTKLDSVLYYQTSSFKAELGSTITDKFLSTTMQESEAFKKHTIALGYYVLKGAFQSNGEEVFVIVPNNNSNGFMLAPTVWPTEKVSVIGSFTKTGDRIWFLNNYTELALL